MEWFKLGELAQRLKYYRKLRRMSVRDLAKLAHVSISYIYAIEAGARGSNATKLGQIAEALGVQLSDLWGDSRTDD
ncbi:helix-turn-helix domain-containing protein [Alicyclobacillus dauci]|uniref:Helix-turn-helix domain-containing protein n=1 Tax=Alicyclobacillus dauci TaxID=1475485 RepID=A0ABY6Z4R6_9BACL|nr:helix-turn-helix transcriptional regulator [Alicyclobacillus dauci]WAH37872.1 helix-turn-helix domain-containing protein [Alicyclobacillus dauci]